MCPYLWRKYYNKIYWSNYYFLNNYKDGKIITRKIGFFWRFLVSSIFLEIVWLIDQGKVINIYFFLICVSAWGAEVVKNNACVYNKYITDGSSLCKRIFKYSNTKCFFVCLIFQIMDVFNWVDNYVLYPLW
jgi:hypothetical protein